MGVRVSRSLGQRADRGPTALGAGGHGVPYERGGAWIQRDDASDAGRLSCLVIMDAEFESLRGFRHVGHAELADLGGATARPPEQFEGVRTSRVSFSSKVIARCSWSLFVLGSVSFVKKLLEADEEIPDGLHGTKLLLGVVGGAVLQFDQLGQNLVVQGMDATVDVSLEDEP